MGIRKQRKTRKSWGFTSARISGKISRFLCTAWRHLHGRQATGANKGWLQLGDSEEKCSEGSVGGM